jgi:hypothetical protein
MSQREFTQLLNALDVLSPTQLSRLRQALDKKLQPPKPPRAKKSPRAAEETAFDVLIKAGLIGCLDGAVPTHRRI